MTTIPTGPVTAQTNYAVAPGQYLAEWLEVEKLTHSNAQILLDLDKDGLDAVLSGRTPVDEALAASLAVVTDIPAAAWLRYEATYRADLERLRAPSTVAIEGKPSLLR